MEPANQSIVHVNSILSFDDIRTVQCQYEKAINGLFEAWKFGKMLAEIEAKIAENKALNYQSASRGLSRQNAGDKFDEMHGWNEGTGLKNWLSENIPTVNYKTAMQFLYLFKKTSSKLPEGEESDETVARQYLEGKSQRQILRRGGARIGSGRKPKNYAAALESDSSIAWKEISEPLQHLSELIVVQHRHLRLTYDRATLLSMVELILETLREEDQ